ncbi:response regulator receiver protein [[Leptolyngbya] sp. PCC 7376]|uniref:response regulator n=1 Tax=[Leptolyngbya] sp. PCC 7376 TaxID=111781 RepID=UPI00029F429D|nr:response regulator [[Leptolyngbya] sp. PCC 7376]AFY38322.1 response regulator receiver protein [[Leptolyngbya] sp. PCC 7376]
MTEPNVPPEIPIRDFNASKQTKLFHTLKKPRFTGCLTLTNPLAREWHFYLYLGRLVYASGGSHAVRCWRRNLTAHMPEIAADRDRFQKDLLSVSSKPAQLYWEYDLLRKWHDQGRVSREQVSQVVQAITTEIFFDVSQSTQVTYRFTQCNYGDNPLILLDVDQMILKAWKLLKQWNTLDISHLSPNCAPKIQNAELLKTRSSASTYNLLNTLITGRATFWDLSIRMKRDVIQVARSMMPYIKLGFIDLATIDDLPAPANLITVASKPKFTGEPISQDLTAGNQKITIAYIDINEDQLEYVGTLLKGLKYRYLPINDPFKAMSVLLAQKPDLILLELDLGRVSGLDMCAQLKKLSLFRQTPVLIVTDTSGIFDRVKSRLMGATDFMLKPFDQTEIAVTLQKYLRLL